jgi:hypothetical protein|tara:strand:- start:30 stop:389 length:360 start_codon:yes stop_codon:yes gene_type:complete
MKGLVYDFNLSHLRRGSEELTSSVKPDFSFAYDALSYSSNDGFNKYQYNNVDTDLTAAQIAEIETFIDGVEADAVTNNNMIAEKHLAETDWYIVRFQETGVAVPNSVTASRAAARASIV